MTKDFDFDKLVFEANKNHNHISLIILWFSPNHTTYHVELDVWYADIDPSSYLSSVERLNLKTWEWQSLQNMQEPRAFADGFTHKGRFFVVGGSATLKHSAEIYNPSTNSWVCLKSFVPKEADGFTAASLNGRLMLLTWSDQLGVKLWLWTVLVNPNLICRCRLISFFPNQIVERPRLKSHGAKMVQVGGKEVWVLVGESDRFCLQVDGSNAWPVFPAPMFRPGDGHEAVQKGHIYAFSFTDGVGLSWRKIPVYSIWVLSVFLVFIFPLSRL